MTRQPTARWFAALLALLAVSVLHAEEGDGAGQWFYFPECEIRVRAPAGWHARNESQSSLGYVLISREEIVGRTGQFQAGVTLYTNYGRVMQREFATTAEFATAWFASALADPPPGSAVGPRRSLGESDLPTPIGDFRAIDLLLGAEGTPQHRVLHAVHAGPRGSTLAVLEAPAGEWETVYPTLLEILRSVERRGSERAGDAAVFSEYPHPLAEIYRQRGPRTWPVVVERISSVRPGMPVSDYERAVGWTTREVAPGQAECLTPGWLTRIQTAADGRSFVDLYGHYDGCLALERRRVVIAEGVVTEVAETTRMPPPDFDRAAWDARLAGVFELPADRVEPATQEFVRDLIAWHGDPARAAAGLAVARGIAPGTDQQEYLDRAGAFVVRWGPVAVWIVPGVLEANGPNPDAEGRLTTTYTYGTPAAEGEESPHIFGRVIVRDGRVAAIESE